MGQKPRFFVNLPHHRHSLTSEVESPEGLPIPPIHHGQPAEISKDRIDSATFGHFKVDTFLWSQGYLTFLLNITDARGCYSFYTLVKCRNHADVKLAVARAIIREPRERYSGDVLTIAIDSGKEMLAWPHIHYAFPGVRIFQHSKHQKYGQISRAFVETRNSLFLDFLERLRLGYRYSLEDLTHALVAKCEERINSQILHFRDIPPGPRGGRGQCTVIDYMAFHSMHYVAQSVMLRTYNSSIQL